MQLSPLDVTKGPIYSRKSRLTIIDAAGEKSGTYAAFCALPSSGKGGIFAAQMHLTQPKTVL